MAATRRQKLGAAYALAAFGMWGFFPIYFKAVSNVGPLEVLCHRVVWSVPLTAVLITIGRDWLRLQSALRERQVWITLFFSAILVAANWFVFIWAVNTDRVLHASLGYFINPLVNVVLGMVFLKERLRPKQTLAVLLAAAGTLVMVFKIGVFPWISFSVALLFGFYGLLRKTVHIESLNGLFVETSMLLPAAGGYLVFLWFKGDLAFGTVGGGTTALLLAAGLVNSLPLLAFASGARLINYSTVGLCQYVAPTLHFLLAVFLYHEPFTLGHLITFGLIWTGLAVFAHDSIKHSGD